MRCAEITWASKGTPNCFSMAQACCITSQSELEPMITPTSGLFCSAIPYTFSFSPVRRSMASKYLAWVLSMTSAGSAGAGGDFFQSFSVSR
jgi:hypothetical protein